MKDIIMQWLKKWEKNWRINLFSLMFCACNMLAKNRINRNKTDNRAKTYKEQPWFYTIYTKQHQWTYRVGVTETNMLLLWNHWKYSILAICGNKKLLSDTILILKRWKSRFKRELLNLSKLFRKPSIILLVGFCGRNKLNHMKSYVC